MDLKLGYLVRLRLNLNEDSVLERGQTLRNPTYNSSSDIYSSNASCIHAATIVGDQCCTSGWILTAG
jgi:hypothetical protein